MTNRRVKECIIFNPETGISEDGTMHDDVYRPCINQPKKERKMTREEAIQIVQKLLETNRLDGTGLSQVWDFLKQPITLADFLGWQEGQEYRRGGNILKVVGNHLLNKRPNGKFYNTNWSTAELIDLRNATKYKPKKYYAKIKGWELTNDNNCYWHKDGRLINTVYPWSREEASIYTKEEWEKLGIDDSNADFIEVE